MNNTPTKSSNNNNNIIIETSSTVPDTFNSLINKRIQPVGGPLTSLLETPLTSDVKYVPNADLHKEEWFHGQISRKESETLVVRDGDFLVRESKVAQSQYVLTGMQNECRKHLLLVDPNGVVSVIVYLSCSNLI